MAKSRRRHASGVRKRFSDGCDPPSGSPAGEQLATQARCGQAERLRPIVERALRRLVRTTDPEYDDLVQHALAGVLAALERGAAERSSEQRMDEPWAAVVARNLAIDRLRARSRERRLFAYEDCEAAPSPSSLPPGSEAEQLADRHRDLRRLRHALRSMPPGTAIVLYLHHVLGYDLGEVAETIGTSIAAAQSRLVRGRRALVRAMRRQSSPLDTDPPEMDPIDPDDVLRWFELGASRRKSSG
jgi:RNA polymerase sigma factor (sigma-70 family)